MRVLVTCPPMVKMIDEFLPAMKERGWEVDAPQVVQTLSEEELIERLPNYDGWIIGDDPATERVFAAGVAGKLKAAVKWGVGTDNVDFEAAKKLGIPITNTQGMFGNEVADVALGMVLMLGRKLHLVDAAVRKGEWIKPRGMSFVGKRAGVVGFGDIGRNVCKRLHAIGMEVTAFDPYFKAVDELGYVREGTWPDGLEEFDFLVFTCALTRENRHMLNEETLGRCKDGVYVVNVARGPLIDEGALVNALEGGKVAGAGLDVFEEEPLSIESPLVRMDNVVLGSHNGSNTREGVVRTSCQVIESLEGYFVGLR